MLYIHIPFCDSKCNYCAFCSYVSFNYLKEDYMKALIIELKYHLKNKKTKFKSIFIGGGTPSVVNTKLYKQLFEILKPYLSNNIEITCEANPNSATNFWLEDMFNLGINRISFGVQSFNDEKLKFLGRNHTSQMAVKSIKTAYEIGFKNINCDIIYDTILDNKKLLNEDLNIIKTLPINHISAYSLTIEDGTKFFNAPKVKVENQILTRYLFNQLNKLGFCQYEISNFAKNNNARSKHNLGYWKYWKYLGVGVGAVSCIKKQRLYNCEDINKYIKNPINYSKVEKLSKKDIKMEQVLLGFRSIVGVNKNILSKNEIKKANDLINANKLKLYNNKYFSIDFMLADELALYILD
jgi:oxygen-independent coproporphyrinogen-3 oxidase